MNFTYKKLFNKKIFMLFFMDLLIWNMSFYLSFAINKNSFSLLGFERLFLQCILIVNICFSLVFIYFKNYDKIWRYADMEDFFYVGISIVFANFLFFLTTFLRNQNLGIRMYVLFLLISEFLNFMTRLVYRVNIFFDNNNKVGKKEKKKLLIVGAGEATSMILREMIRYPENEYLPICIVDDDRSKIGRSIAGIEVKGSVYEIPQICKNENIEVILFSIVNINSIDKQRILDICSRTNIEVKLVPNIYETFSNSNASIFPYIRHVEIEDLLGREPIIFNKEKSGTYIKNKIVLVTGGGGSIGSEICRQIASLNPKKLIILDIYENNAYEIEQELLRSYYLPNSKNKDNKKLLNFEIKIASVRDMPKMEKIFLEENINVVFHAAAHKHVPLMESNPEEAVKNNIIGTYNVALCAKKYKIEKFVLISTDKAVRPLSVMGATKRVCEMIIQYMSHISLDKINEEYTFDNFGNESNFSKIHKKVSQNSTYFCAVRFGNVLGSNGSVIPLFRKQIKSKGPITITDARMTRFFMTIPEAVSLVLIAGSLAKSGQILVLDMGNPVKIQDLAENLIRLSGLIPHKDIKIKYTGLRPGEKLEEEILIDKNNIKFTENNKIFIDDTKLFDLQKFSKLLNELSCSDFINDFSYAKIRIQEMIKLVS